MKVISDGRAEDWSTYRTGRVAINKELDNLLAKYVANKVDNSSSRWSTFKEITGKTYFFTHFHSLSNLQTKIFYDG